METVQQNGRFTLFSSKFPSNIYSILFEQIPSAWDKDQAASSKDIVDMKRTYPSLNGLSFKITATGIPEQISEIVFLINLDFNDFCTAFLVVIIYKRIIVH